MNYLKNKFFFFSHCVFFVLFLFCNKEVAFADAEMNMSDQKLFVDADRNSIVLWVNNINGETNINSSMLPFGSTTWTDPVVISAKGTTISRFIAGIDTFGNILAVWTAFNPDFKTNCIGSNFKLNGREWNTPTNISGETQNVNDTLSLKIDQDFMQVVWSAYDERSQNLLYTAIGSTDSGRWNSPQAIVTPSFFGL